MNKTMGLTRKVHQDGFVLAIDAQDSLGLSDGVAYEPATLAAIQRWVRPGDVAVDVGANIGFFTAHLARAVGPQGVVHAVEPEPDNFNLLSQNMQANGLTQVCCHAVALGEVSASAQLHLSPANHGMHRLYASVCCTGPTVSVPVQRLDTLLHGLAQIDFLKIDIEGYELQALRGAQELLERSPHAKLISEYCPTAMLEAGGSPSALLTFLHTLGFYPHDLTGKPLDLLELQQDASRYEAYGRERFVAACAGKDHGAILQHIAQVAQELGCRRPVIENLLFMRPVVSHHLLAFSFPLNVYGALLQWSEGRVDYLHYGLFESLEEPIWQAQERASQRLWAQLPPPCRVLEVGIGLGQTLARLGERGYHAVGITPEPAQVAYAQAQHGGRLTVHTTRLEDYAPESERYDLLLLQESAQYIQPLDLFEAADRLLDPQQATLLVMDEFALTRASDADFGLHLLPHFKALAQRFGWQLVHEEDVTAAALLTLDVLQALTQRHAARVRQEIGLSDAELQALDSSTARYAHNYRAGVFGYRVLRFERQALPTLRPVVLDGHASAEDAVPAAMRALFQRVFGRDMDAAEWHWKYGHGRGYGIGLSDRDGQLRAFYGGLSRHLLLFGRPVVGCQICDVMIEPGARASLLRQGPAYQVAATYVERWVGWTRTYPMGFGFPTDRALGIAEKLGLYARADEMLQLHWPALDAPADDGTTVQAIDLSTFDESHPVWPDVQGLWAAMAADFAASVLGVRDAPWLQYRYAKKPGATYEALVLRQRVAGGAEDSPGDAIGIVVYRRHATHLELLDVVAPACSIPALVQVVRNEAARDPAGAPLPVVGWVTVSHASLWIKANDGVVREPLNLIVPANAYTAGVPPDALRNRWFLTAGDTDFR